MTSSPEKSASASLSVKQNLHQEVTQWLQTGHNGHVISDIQVIGHKDIGGQEFMCADYRLDGKLILANIIKNKQGYGIGSIGPQGKSSKAPWISCLMIANNDLESVCGLVNDSKIKEMVITFTNGLVAQVPVVDGGFFYVTNTPLRKGTVSKELMGITANGKIIIE